MAKTSFSTQAKLQTPDSWGYKNEFKYYLKDNLDLLDTSRAMLDIRELPPIESELHETAHGLYALSLQTPDATEGMKRKFHGHVYQCHMQGELPVHTIEDKGLKRILADPRQKLDDEFFNTFVNALGRMGHHHDLIRLGNFGSAAAFYIGKNTGKTMDAVNKRHASNADELARAATKLMRNWERTVKPGDTYTASGKVQRYTPLYNPANDEDDKEALRRLAPILRIIQKRIQKYYRPSRWDPNTNSVRWAKGLKIRDIMAAMSPG